MDKREIEEAFKSKLGEPDNPDAFVRYMKIIGMCHESGHCHHILPRAVFPEFADFRIHAWNRVVLSADCHALAHSELFRAWGIRAFQRPLNFRHADDEETRRSMSRAAIRGWANMDEETRREFGAKRTKYLKEQAARKTDQYIAFQEAALRNVQCPEFRAAASDRSKRYWEQFDVDERSAMIKARLTPEVKARMSNGVRNRYLDDEYAAEHAIRVKEVNGRMEKRRAAGDTIRGLWSSGDYAEKVIAARKTESATNSRFLSAMKNNARAWLQLDDAYACYLNGDKRYAVEKKLGGITCAAMWRKFDAGYVPTGCLVYKQFKEWYETNQS